MKSIYIRRNYYCGVGLKAVEGSNMNNEYTLNRFQKRCFTPFYLYTLTFVVLNRLLLLFFFSLSLFFVEIELPKRQISIFMQ